MMTAVIIDDEPAARRSLYLIVQKYCCEEVQIIGEAGSVKDGYTLIEKLKPQLVFLDIEMGKQTGFDLIAKFRKPFFHIVFVTAYDQYAIRAIKICALDYLLKPLNINEVLESVAKAKATFAMPAEGSFQNLVNVITKKGDGKNQIAVPVSGGYRLIAAEDINYLKAEKEYTYIHCIDGETCCSAINLGYYEDILADYPFFRVHHSYLINKKHLTQFNKKDGGELLMTNGSSIPVSRRRKTAFIQWLKK